MTDVSLAMEIRNKHAAQARACFLTSVIAADISSVLSKRITPCPMRRMSSCGGILGESRFIKGRSLTGDRLIARTCYTLPDFEVRTQRVI